MFHNLNIVYLFICFLANPGECPFRTPDPPFYFWGAPAPGPFKGLLVLKGIGAAAPQTPALFLGGLCKRPRINPASYPESIGVRMFLANLGP